jgi:hypothetical protein
MSFLNEDACSQKGLILAGVSFVMDHTLIPLPMTAIPMVILSYLYFRYLFVF